MTELKALCAACGLGDVLEVRPLSGGFLHQMMGVRTTTGRYAVKLLNPHIMARPQVLDNYRSAEALEARLEAAHLPILPALTIGGRKMQHMAGRYAYIFPWRDGRALRPDEVSPAHCARIGALMAGIHLVDMHAGVTPRAQLSIDFDGHIARLAHDPELHALLMQHRDLLRRQLDAGNAAQLPELTAICHNDMDCKNVLWQDGAPLAIDLECLGYANPMMELFELALSWSGLEDHALDFTRLRAFLLGYAQAGGTLPTCWEALYHANTNRLDWLDYNLRRAQGIECDPADIPMARQEVRNTIAHAAYYASIQDELLYFLNTIPKEHTP